MFRRGRQATTPSTTGAPEALATPQRDPARAGAPRGHQRGGSRCRRRQGVVGRLHCGAVPAFPEDLDGEHPPSATSGGLHCPRGQSCRRGEPPGGLRRPLCGLGQTRGRATGLWVAESLSTTRQTGRATHRFHRRCDPSRDNPGDPSAITPTTTTDSQRCRDGITESRRIGKTESWNRLFLLEQTLTPLRSAPLVPEHEGPPSKCGSRRNTILTEAHIADRQLIHQNTVPGCRKGSSVSPQILPCCSVCLGSYAARIYCQDSLQM